MKQFKKGLFIFHRDLRVEDNRGLQQALRECEVVMPIFIFDPIQIGTKNVYRSQNALQFMAESLHDLADALHNRAAKLYVFHGHTDEIIKKLLTHQSIDVVFANRDYTPFARARDTHLEELVKKHKAQWQLVDDALLTNPDEIFTGSGTPYTIYTAFFKKAVQQTVLESQVTRGGTFFTGRCEGTITLGNVTKDLYVSNSHLFTPGGAQEGKKKIRHLSDFKHYTQTRDIPFLATTGLSAHLKFGTVSVRKVYEGVKEQKADPALIKQLYWRDFFTHLGYHFPYVFGKAFVKKYQHISWGHNEVAFEKWCTGMTGFPLVDAGMRQLVNTGWMHNRVRMIVASFLTKDLHIDWRKGEQFFAQHLIDYDPCVNNGNWQWAASTGADAQPYFRIFNPWLQQKKFDPDCTYIKQWAPELRDLEAKAIHSWYKALAPYKKYPLPIVDHAVESKKAIGYFK